MSRIYDALKRSESLRSNLESGDPLPDLHPPRFVEPERELPAEPAQELLERLCSLEVAVYAMEDRLALDLPALQEEIHGRLDKSALAVADRDHPASERLAVRIDQTAARVEEALSRTERRLAAAGMIAAALFVALTIARW